MCKIDVDNVIFFPHKLDIRAGGPAGYIANLKNRLDANNIKVVSADKFCFDLFELMKFFIKLIPNKQWRKSLRFRVNFAKMCSKHLPLFLFFKLHRYNFKTIICHRVWDVPMIRRYINKYNPTAKLMLMSHCPQSPSSEFWEALESRQKKQITLKKIEKFEKEAFELADYLIFPSDEATEPYSFSIPYFDELKKTKKFYYIPTGANKIEISKNKEELRNKYNITTQYVISYLGRHNEIKGYDLLKKIAQSILDKRDDITFLIAGNLSNDIKPLEHPKWIEIGRTHPTNVLSIADLFILPNRQTYFDLVLLEVLSSGVPVFASNTGGNKSVYKQTGAIKLYDTIDDCVNLIDEFFMLTEKERKALGNKCVDSYLANYTPEIFANNYKNMIKQIVEDIK